ncbi:MAG TPA: hypothetical protein VL860_08320 [Planctomycetota bacterium]|nr:hypothetical protein [Planctomycetota bacterium]
MLKASLTGLAGICLSALLLSTSLAAAETICADPAHVRAGQPIQLRLLNDPCPDRECALLLYDPSAHLMAVQLIPASRTEYAPTGPFSLSSDGLEAGKYTVKLGRRDSDNTWGPFTVLAATEVTLTPRVNPVAPGISPAPQTLGQPEKPLLFWRNLPLAVEHKDDWQKLLQDTDLAGPTAPFDGPTLVLPLGAQSSRALIQSEVDPVLRRRGLVICETWPVPLNRSDMPSVEALTGLMGPAVDIEPPPAEWSESEWQNRLLAARDPESHRLYGLSEKSFAYLTHGLKTYPTTEVLRWAADGTPAVTLRLYPSGGAVVVLNTLVSGYSALASAPVQNADWLGATPAEARAVLRAQTGGVALRAALKLVHGRLAARRKAIGEDLPMWNLKSVLRVSEPRTFELRLTIEPTARTLPDLTPPTVIAVRLLHQPRKTDDPNPIVAAWQIPVVKAEGRQTFRVPLDDSGYRPWSLEIENPFTGSVIELDLKVGDPIYLDLRDAPAEPAPAPAAEPPAAVVAPAPPAPPAPAQPVPPPKPVAASRSNFSWFGSPIAPIASPSATSSAPAKPAATPAPTPARAPTPSKTKID